MAYLPIANGGGGDEKNLSYQFPLKLLQEAFGNCYVKLTRCDGNTRDNSSLAPKSFQCSGNDGDDETDSDESGDTATRSIGKCTTISVNNCKYPSFKIIIAREKKVKEGWTLEDGEAVYYANLEDHVTVTKKGRYECGYCKETFASMKNVRRHQARNTCPAKPKSVDGDHHRRMLPKRVSNNFNLKKPDNSTASNTVVTNDADLKPYVCAIPKPGNQGRLLRKRIGANNANLKPSGSNSNTKNETLKSDNHFTKSQSGNQGRLLRERTVSKMNVKLDDSGDWGNLNLDNCTNVSVKRGIQNPKPKTTQRHKCTLCGKRFTRRKTLRDHMNVHRGIKPHKCLTCSKAFARASNLWEHNLVHTGTKRHKCETCGKAFYRASTLWEHAAAHSDARPFECPHCDVKCKRKKSLTRHIERAHWKELKLKRPVKGQKK